MGNLFESIRYKAGDQVANECAADPPIGPEKAEVLMIDPSLLPVSIDIPTLLLLVLGFNAGQITWPTWLKRVVGAVLVAGLRAAADVIEANNR